MGMCPERRNVDVTGAWRRDEGKEPHFILKWSLALHGKVKPCGDVELILPVLTCVRL